MPIITEVRFAHEDGALADTLGALPDFTVTVVQEASTDPERDVYLLGFDDGDDTDLRPFLEADHTVREVTPMPEFEERRMWGVEFAAEATLLAPQVTSEDGFVLEARSANADREPRGWHEHWLLPDREALHDIWQYARDEGFAFEVLEFRQQGRADPEYSGPDAPTEQQREALVAAYERGYFAEPRETSLEELAESLGLSSTAVAGRLRRGMRSLIGMTLVVDSSEG